jgi:hypothetical protein
LIGVGSALLDWLTGGSALAALGKVSLAICALVFGLVYRRYLGILGADRRRPAERQVYDTLRESLIKGNLAARLYAERLTRFLDWVDGFFGDAGTSDQTLFPHAFGLRTPAPLWTAPAFDRCLLLALIYPIATIFVIWAVSSHVGPAEAALHLKSDLSGWERAFSTALAAGLAMAMLFIWRDVPMKDWKALPTVVLSILAVALLVAGAVAKLDPVSVGVVLLGAVIAARVVARGGAGAFAFGLAFVLFGAFVGNAAGILIIGNFLAGIIALAAAGSLSVLSDIAIRHRHQGLFLSLFSFGMILTCLGAVHFLAPVQTWNAIGPLLLFLGLLTLLNAPFDWFSLGLTRALLRRGLELGGWWPYGLALVDACLAAGIIALLALAMVIGVQAFDALAVHGGGEPVLPLEPLFSGIAAHPTAPEYWWFYALLLSTMIPSLINLVIGGTSLARGFPGLPRVLLRFMPDRGGVLKWERAWIAAVLTFQAGAGAALGVAAQVFLVVVILGYIMPFFGLELLDMARDVAALNLPARVGQLFGVSL